MPSDADVVIGTSAKPVNAPGGLKVGDTTVVNSSGALLTSPDITVASVTTGIGLAMDDNTALTTGQLQAIASSATAITTTGRLLSVIHSGATTTAGTLVEFKTSANDETILAEFDAASLTSGTIVQAVGTALTSGKALSIAGLDALTTGIGINLTSAATAIQTTGRMLYVDHTGATTTSGILNELKTAANDETELLRLTAESLTTGKVLNFGAMAALTTGIALNMAHTTSVIADGGCLIKVSSSSIDTGGATVGTLLDLKSTAQVAGTLVRLDTVVTTGTAMSIIGTGTMTTTGNLLTLTANSATTAAGILRINCNGITDGIGAVITSSATAATATGRLLRVDHTGATSASGAGIVAEVASAATDATTVLRVTASAALAAGAVLDLVGTSVTTGTILDMGGLDALTTGMAINIVSNSSSNGTRSLVYVKNDNTSATATTCLELVNDAPLGAISTTVAATSTNFFKVGVFNGVTLWVGNGNTGQGALTGTAGDILFNGGTNKPEYCTGTTNWTALV